jgi:hypothetical protein
MPVYEGHEEQAPCIPQLRTRWRWVISYMILALHPRERASNTHYIEGSVCPRISLDKVEVLCHMEASKLQNIIIYFSFYIWLVIHIQAIINLVDKEGGHSEQQELERGQNPVWANTNAESKEISVSSFCPMGLSSQNIGFKGAPFHITNISSQKEAGSKGDNVTHNVVSGLIPYGSLPSYFNTHGQAPFYLP